MEQLSKNIIMESPKILTIEADFNLSEKVINFIMDSYEQCLSSATIKFQLNMIIDEIFGNISTYAFNQGRGIVNIVTWIDENPLRLNIKFIDNGIPFNPLEMENPDISASLDNRKLGGLGIFIIKNMVDSLAYKYINHCNVLTITKVLN